MNFNLIQIVEHMGVFDKAIFVTLTLMALASLIVFFERVIAFLRSRGASRAFAATATELLARNDLAGLAKKADETGGSHLASLLGAGARVFLAERGKSGGKVSPVELARREMLRKTEALAADVRRGLSVLASVGSVAPFVGLLGTVLGIINSFQSIAKEGSGGLGTVSSGISEALIVTAAGLVVAIPAVLAFNFLTTQSDGILRALDQSRGEFLDFLENAEDHGRAPAAHPANGATTAAAIATGPETSHERRA
ncbi:MAG: MotA/TolQ/ExbB proton channel family protein [Myxococcaceae bacterium]|nr:MotA/TolQ/ExbB proton channel family protein [Myxococcaceae bacterium]